MEKWVLKEQNVPLVDPLTIIIPDRDFVIVAGCFKKAPELMRVELIKLIGSDRMKRYLLRIIMGYYNAVCTRKDLKDNSWRNYCDDCILSRLVPHHCEGLVERDYCFYMNHGVVSKKDMLKELSKLLPDDAEKLVTEIVKDLAGRLKK